MPARDDPVTNVCNSRGQFETTHWSVVLAAADGTSPTTAIALEKLCAAYWYPLYAYVRRRGHPPHDAEDLTQAFFHRLLEKNYVAAADRRRGRFRTFLLSSFSHFLADEWDKTQRQKRGGGQTQFSFDAQMAEERYRIEPADPLDAATVYEQRWVASLLCRMLARLEQEYQATGRAETFTILRSFLTGDHGEMSYAHAARHLNLTENAAKQAVHRLRRRYREIFREEIAQTVAEPSEIDEEVRHILAVISG